LRYIWFGPPPVNRMPIPQPSLDSSRSGFRTLRHSDTVLALLEGRANVHFMNDAALRWARNAGKTETAKVLEDWMARDAQQSPAPQFAG
jgi:hypothetical protein